MKRQLLIAAFAVSMIGTAASADIIVASQDHTVRNNGPSVEGNLHIKQSNSNSTDRYGMIRFDSTDFGANVSSATFLLTANSDTSVQFKAGPYNYRVYGVPDGTVNDEVFIENAGNYDPTLGPVWDATAVNRVDTSALTLLGDTGNVSAGDTINFNDPNLLTFIQADTNDVVTLVVVRVTVGDNSTFLDRTTGSPPRLDITVVPEPTSLALLGLGSLLIARRRR